MCILVLGLLLQLSVGAPEGAVSGQILTREGKPAVGVRVGAMAVPEEETPGGGAAAVLGLTVTDADGHYRLEAVPAGRYYIIAGYLNSPTYYPGATSPAEARAVDVKAGGAVADVNFRLSNPAGVRVRGRVENVPDALDKTGLHVILTTAVPQTAGQLVRPVDVVLRDDNTFEFERVPPGSYTLRVTFTGSAPLVTQPMTIDDEELAELKLALPALVVGRVTVDDGSELPVQMAAVMAGVPDAPAFVRLEAVAEGQPPQRSTVRKDGSFVFAPPAGEYQLRPAALPFGYYVRSVIQDGTELQERPFRVGRNALSELQVVLTSTAGAGATPGFRVSGRITNLPQDDNASPLWVSLTGQTQPIVLSTVLPQRVGEVQLRPDGSFEFTDVHPGNYMLRLFPPDRFFATQSVIVETADVLNLSVAATTRPVPPSALSPASSHRVQGRAIAVPGTTRMPAQVRLRSLSQPPAYDAITAIASNGTFTFTGVTPGGYDVNILDWPVPAGRSFNFEAPGDVTGLEVKLPVEVRGRVIRKDGSLFYSAGLVVDVSYPMATIANARTAPVQDRSYAVATDGTFTILAVQGSQTIRVANMISAQYGAQRLENGLLQIDSPNTSEIVVTVE